MAVYFIQAGENGPVKIGKAANVARRLVSLQTGNHELLSIIREVAGDEHEEQFFHRHYDKLRLHHEWFTFCPTMLSANVPPDFWSKNPLLSRQFNSLELELLTEIEAFLVRHGMSEAAFGKHAINDGVFMWEFRRKRSPSLNTAERIRRFMASYQQKAA